MNLLRLLFEPPAPMTLAEVVRDVLKAARWRYGRAEYRAEWTLQDSGRWLLTVWRYRGDTERYIQSVEARTGLEAAGLMLSSLEE